MLHLVNHVEINILAATRITAKSCSLLDQIWTNMPNKTNSLIIDVNITDHCPVFAEFELANAKSEEMIKIKFRDFSAGNHVLFRNAVQNIDWLDLVQLCNTSSDMAKTFLNKLDSLFNHYFPIKIKNMSVKRLNSPWMTDAIIKSVRLKHLKLRQLKLGQIDKISCDLYCKILTKVIKRSKKMYYRDSFLLAQNDLKKVMENY